MSKTREDRPDSRNLTDVCIGGGGGEGDGQVVPQPYKRLYNSSTLWTLKLNNVTDFKVFFPAVLTDLGSIFADWFQSKERVYFFNNT